MRFALLLSVLFLQPVLSAAAVDPKTEPMPTPLMRTVDPYTAKVGTEVTVSGDHLDKNIVEEVYLSVEGKNIRAEIVDQSGETDKVQGSGRETRLLPSRRSGPDRGAAVD